MSDDATSEPPMDGEGEDGSGPADDLLAAAEGLGGEVARVRRRAGRARRRGRVLAEDGVVTDDEPAVRVRSTAEEGVAPGGSTSSRDRDDAVVAGGDDGDVGPVGDDDEPGLLDASGAVIDAPAGADRTSVSAASVRTVDPGVFLADAVRGYLDSLDAHGADHPVTADRLARLRRTWDLWDQGGG